MTSPRPNPAVRRVLLAAASCALAASPLLGDAPEDPSFAARRARLLAAHDADHDGRLDAAEREAMRAALKAKRLDRKASAFQIPAEFLAKHDRNKDGEMSGEEWKAAWEAETKVLTATYDADKDGKLGPAEKKAMLADVAAGKITGVLAFFAQRMVEDPRAGEPEYLDGPRELLKFDANGNGRADAAELQKIRESRAKAR